MPKFSLFLQNNLESKENSFVLAGLIVLVWKTGHHHLIYRTMSASSPYVSATTHSQPGVTTVPSFLCVLPCVQLTIIVGSSYHLPNDRHYQMLELQKWTHRHKSLSSWTWRSRSWYSRVSYRYLDKHACVVPFLPFLNPNVADSFSTYIFFFF